VHSTLERLSRCRSPSFHAWSSLDGGTTSPHGASPRERNPVLLTNDGEHDNWDGEVAVALRERVARSSSASSSRKRLLARHQRQPSRVERPRGRGRARAGSASISIRAGLTFEMPGRASSRIRCRMASAGAQLIVATAHRGRPHVPTDRGCDRRGIEDVADAYLLDHSIVDRSSWSRR